MIFSCRALPLTLPVHFFYSDFSEDALVVVDEAKLKVARGEEANKTNARFS